MPLYEYVCETDGTRVELLRTMAEADAPVRDPDGKGRVFTRVLSVFAGHGSAASPGQLSGSSARAGGCCPCGKDAGACSSRN
jgi:putative FmdB family regulatory protein